MPTAWDLLSIPNIPNTIPKIAICIPYNSDWKPEWVDKTYGPLKYIPTNWCTKIIFLSKVQSLPVARDILVNQALQTNCDYIFFLDIDMVFEIPGDPNIALNQLYHVINKNQNVKDGKIVSGLYRAKQPQGFNWAMWIKMNEKGFAPIMQWNGNWLEVAVTGLGCTLIDSNVFKDIKRPWFKWDLSDGTSEDFYFFQLAKSHGWNTHVFTDIRLSHLGGLKVKSDGSIVTPDM